jgi:hypothetical protein
MIDLDPIPALSHCPAPGSAPAIPRPHLRRAARLGGLAILLGALPGCQSVTGTTSVAQVRVIDASTNVSALDVYQGSAVLAYNLGLGTITSYVPTTPGTFGINVDVAGTKTQVSSAYGTFQNGGQYTVIVGDASTSLQETILTDQTIPAPTGQVALRFVDSSSRGGAVDLYLIPSGSNITQVRAVLTGVAFGTNTGYIDVPAGTYTLAAVPSGTTPTTSTATSYSGASVYYPSGTARTIVLIDQQLITTPGIQVVVADDYDPVGAPN